MSEKKKNHSTKHSIEEYKKGLRLLRKKFPEFKSLSNTYKPEFNLLEKRSPYEALVRSIAHQQVHAKAAESILKRFIALYPGRKFPTPEQVNETPFEKLREAGFSTNKSKAIKDIAVHAMSGVVPDKKEIGKLSNEEIIQRLIPIYGVGRWTVEMILLFQFGRLDVWPVDDFGIRRGYQIWKKLKKMPTAKELKDSAKEFSPYESILSLHLWQLSNTTKIIPE